MRCKPGDMAIIIRADNDPDELGKIVTVVALRIAMGDLAWQIDPPVFWIDEDTGIALEVMWDDRDLFPIRGGEVIEEISSTNPPERMTL